MGNDVIIGRTLSRFGVFAPDAAGNLGVHEQRRA
jgi:hypothetical protein